MKTKRVRRTEAGTHCQAVECALHCQPACSPTEQCVLGTMQECGQCPLAHCVPSSTLGVSTLDTNPVSESPESNTGLIAGLTTGLVVGAAIVATIAGLAFFKRRRSPEQSTPHNRSLSETNPVPIVHSNPFPPPPPSYAHMTPMNTVLTPWPQAPKPAAPHTPLSSTITPPVPNITTTPPMDAQPHDHVSPTVQTTGTIRQSLNIGPSSPISPPKGTRPLNRSSSVKVTKYDYGNSKAARHEFTDTMFDDLENENSVMIRRAVSLRKGESKGLTRSASARSVPVDSGLSEGSAQGSVVQLRYAKPTRVRMNTIHKQGGVVRKASVRSIGSQRSKLPENEGETSTDPSKVPPKVPLNELPKEHELEQPQVSQVNTPQIQHSSNVDEGVAVFWDSSHSREYL